MISRLPVAGLVVFVGVSWPAAAEKGHWPSGAEAVSVIRERFVEDHGRICSFGSRFAGQPGCEKTAEYIESEMKAAGVMDDRAMPSLTVFGSPGTYRAVLPDAEFLDTAHVISPANTGARLVIVVGR